MSFSKEFYLFLDQIAMFYRSTSYGIVWFRGHRKSDYELQSGLFREVHIKNEEDLQHLITFESQLYNTYMSKGRNFHNASGWELVYLMQHHRAPTRLLDWTTSLSTALYFATESWKEKEDCSPEVWALDPIALNRRAFDVPNILVAKEQDYQADLRKYKEGGYFSHSYAIYPILNNARIVAQKGMFTIQGNSGVPLNEEVFPYPVDEIGSSLTENEIKRFPIAPELQKDIARFLLINGIDKSSIFPDLDAFSDEMRASFSQYVKSHGIKRERFKVSKT